jgi:hypothetical protein
MTDGQVFRGVVASKGTGDSDGKAVDICMIVYAGGDSGSGMSSMNKAVNVGEGGTAADAGAIDSGSECVMIILSVFVMATWIQETYSNSNIPFVHLIVLIETY